VEHLLAKYTRPPLRESVPGEIFAVKIDTELKRVRVCSRGAADGKDCVRVELVDSGKVCTVVESDLLSVRRELALIPQLAAKCFFSALFVNEARWKEECSKILGELLMDDDVRLFAKINTDVPTKNGVVAVDIKDDEDANVSELFASYISDVVPGVVLSETKKKSDANKLFVIQDLPKDEADLDNSKTKCTSTDRRDLMYLQDASRLHDLRRIEASICDGRNFACAATHLKEDLLVLAEFVDDGLLYRAHVMKLLPNDEVGVRFIDYGDRLKVARYKVFLIPEDFVLFPAFATRVRLWHVEAKEWKPQEKAQFSSFMSEKQFAVTVVENGSVPVVTLSTDSEPFVINSLKREVFVDDGFQESKFCQLALKSDVLEEDQVHDVRITHIGDADGEVGCVYVFRERDQGLMDAVVENSKSKWGDRKNIEFRPERAGQIVIVREDEEFFRAAVLKIDKNAIDIRLVDFGRIIKDVLMSDVFPLSNKLDGFPALAAKCKLAEDDDDLRSAMIDSFVIYEELKITVLRRTADEHVIEIVDQ
jgi:hypothetical protein